MFSCEFLLLWQTVRCGRLQPSVKYSYEIPNEYLSGSMAISLLAYVAIFLDSLVFRKATSSQFLRVTFFKVSQELLFRSSSFFRADAFFEELLFQNSHFFPAFFSPEYLLVQSETSTQEPNLENRKFFSAVTFQNSYPQKTYTEELLLWSRFFCPTSIFSKKARFWKRLLFQKSKIPHYLLFPENCLFNSFFINRYILSQLYFQKSFFFTTYLFRRVTISQVSFFSTATLPIN